MEGHRHGLTLADERHASNESFCYERCMERIGAGPSLEVRDLKVVMALGRAGSTAAAATELHLTQSAVSRALQLAESRLGVPLFVRGARGMTPTDAGRRLIEGAPAVLASLSQLEAATRGAQRAPTKLRLVCECYTAYRWLPSTLASLGEAFEVTLPFEHTADPVAALRAGELDVALLTTAKVPRALREAPLFSDEILIVMADSHPLARRTAVTAADLLAHRLLLSSQTPEAEQRWFAHAVFGKARPTLRPLRFPLTEAIVDAARAGLGLAVLTEWIAAPYLGGAELVARRIALRGGRALKRPWRIAYRPEKAAEARQLATLLVDAAPRLQHTRRAS